MADYNKVGLLVLQEKQILMCRKKYGTSQWILPGGCMEPGESPMQCLTREIREELGMVEACGLLYLGTYFEEAAFDDPAIHKTLEMQLYQGSLIGCPVASSEIKELVWFGEHSDAHLLTPIMKNQILPDLLNRGILPWEACSWI